MAPMTIAPVRHVVKRSFARRRRRAAALMVAGYAATWTAGCTALVIVSLTMRAVLPPAVATFGVVAGAIAWQCSPPKQGCLNRTHAHRGLTAFGRAADVDAVRFGIEHGFWCVGSCWALMLAALIVDSAQLGTMAFLTMWLWAERLDRPMPPTWRIPVPCKAVRLAIAQARAHLLLPVEHARPQ
jgi:predicted metal-binding membrane protein